MFRQPPTCWVIVFHHVASAVARRMPWPNNLEPGLETVGQFGCVTAVFFVRSRQPDTGSAAHSGEVQASDRHDGHQIDTSEDRNKAESDEAA